LSGSFGQGGDITTSYGGGGGGGWYGGGGDQNNAGSGGSSYLGGVASGVTFMSGDPGFVPNPDTTGNGTVIITSTVPCTGTPTAGTASATSRNCNSEPFTLSVQGATAGGNITYQWESSPAGTNNFSPISGATTASYTVTNQTTDTDYRFVVTCTNSNSDDTSNVVTVTQAATPTTFYENFDTTPTGSSSNNTVPSCWTYLKTGTSTSFYGYTDDIAGQTTNGFYAYRSSSTSATG